MDSTGAGLGRRASFVKTVPHLWVPGQQETSVQMREYQRQLSALCGREREGGGGEWTMLNSQRFVTVLDER
jgi:hypothetical protein